jgi:hypothetical protein
MLYASLNPRHPGLENKLKLDAAPRTPADALEILESAPSFFPAAGLGTNESPVDSFSQINPAIRAKIANDFVSTVYPALKYCLDTSTYVSPSITGKLLESVAILSALDLRPQYFSALAADVVRAANILCIPRSGEAFGANSLKVEREVAESDPLSLEVVDGGLTVPYSGPRVVPPAEKLFLLYGDKPLTPTEET